jgi:4-carboxymuconolactone decarboxylase
MSSDRDPRVARFSGITRESLPPEAQAIWDRRTRQVNTASLSGHFNVLMHAPELCARISELEGYFRTESTISAHEREMVTLAVLREAQARFAWSRHERRAIERGVGPEVVEALRSQAPLAAFPPQERMLVEIARALARAGGTLPDELAARALDALGERKLVEMIGLIGHYILVGVLVNGFGVRMIEGDPPTF